MAVIDTGSSVVGKANVTNLHLQVRNPIALAELGMVGLACLLDDGATRVDSALTPYGKRLATSDSGGLRH